MLVRTLSYLHGGDAVNIHSLLLRYPLLLPDIALVAHGYSPYITIIPITVSRSAAIDLILCQLTDVLFDATESIWLISGKQSLLTTLCGGVITILCYLVIILTLPVSAWFTFKVSNWTPTMQHWFLSTEFSCLYTFARLNFQHFTMLKDFDSVAFSLFQKVQERERLVIFRIGRLLAPKGPGGLKY